MEHELGYKMVLSLWCNAIILVFSFICSSSDLFPCWDQYTLLIAAHTIRPMRGMQPNQTIAKLTDLYPVEQSNIKVYLSSRNFWCWNGVRGIQPNQTNVQLTDLFPVKQSNRKVYLGPRNFLMLFSQPPHATKQTIIKVNVTSTNFQILLLKCLIMMIMIVLNTKAMFTCLADGDSAICAQSSSKTRFTLHKYRDKTPPR